MKLIVAHKETYAVEHIAPFAQLTFRFNGISDTAKMATINQLGAQLKALIPAGELNFFVLEQRGLLTETELERRRSDHMRLSFFAWPKPGFVKDRVEDGPTDDTIWGEAPNGGRIEDSTTRLFLFGIKFNGPYPNPFGFNMKSDECEPRTIMTNLIIAAAR